MMKNIFLFYVWEAVIGSRALRCNIHSEYNPSLFLLHYFSSLGGKLWRDWCQNGSNRCEEILLKILWGKD